MAAGGGSLVVHEWTDSGSSYMHIYRTNDEAWHVLEKCLQFRFPHSEDDAQAGTTVFVPAGCPHTHLPDRGAQSVFHHLDTSVDRPIAKLRSLSDKPRRARDRTLRPY
jgi:uncharacterized cupin superfamily protein